MEMRVNSQRYGDGTYRIGLLSLWGLVGQLELGDVGVGGAGVLGMVALGVLVARLAEVLGRLSKETTALGPLGLWSCVCLDWPAWSLRQQPA